LLLAAVVSAQVGAPTGAFSRRAVALTPKSPSASPDGAVTVSVKWLDDNTGETFPGLLRVRSISREFEQPFTFALNAEILWSPDRARFAVTGSAQGADGQYHTSVATITPSRLIWFDPTSAVETAFGHPVRCDWPELPNVGAITWLSTTHLLVAAQIVHHSNCDRDGTFVGYVVDVIRRRIVREYSYSEVEQRWRAELGWDLADRR
jgi:hypothetical protein